MLHVCRFCVLQRQGLLDCNAMGNGDTLGHERSGKGKSMDWSLPCCCGAWLLWIRSEGLHTFAGADDDYKVPFLLDIFMKLTLLCLRLVCSKIFQNFITFVIILASVMVGIQTYPSLENNQYLNVMDSVWPDIPSFTLTPDLRVSNACTY